MATDQPPGLPLLHETRSKIVLQGRSKAEVLAQSQQAKITISLTSKIAQQKGFVMRKYGAAPLQ